MMKPLQFHATTLLISLIFFGAIFFPGISYAQVKFSAICPEKTISKNDFLQVQFMVENADDVESIVPPSFKNFSVVSGPNQQSGMSNINGKIDHYIAISFFLKPTTTGKCTIGAATARINGKKYSSQPIVVQVVNTSNTPASRSRGSSSPFTGLGFDFPDDPTVHRFQDYILKEGENVNDKVAKNLFIKLVTSKSSCFIGEPIVASYKLYTRLRSESVVTQAPSFNGFSVSDLEVNNNYVQVEKYNGRDYNVYTLRKVQLYPLQPGTLTLDPVVTDNKVTFLRSDYAGSQKGDLFYDMLQDFANSTSPQSSLIEERVSLKSEPVQIIVKALAANRPADFKGAIGDFKISASLEKNNITTDDAGNLKITLRGKGNIQLINAPKVSWPAGIDGYDANVLDDIDKFSVPMHGDKTFTYPFTVSKAGDYIIPPVTFSFFNPASQNYQTLQTQPIKMKVEKGRGASQNAYATRSTQASVQAPGKLTRSAPFLIGGVVLVSAFFLVRRKRSSGRNNNLITASQTDLDVKVAGGGEEFLIPENPLEAAHEKLVEQNEIEFYRVLDTSIKNYVATKLKVPVAELTKKRMNEQLDKCDVGLGTSLMLTSLLEEIELNVYAPSANANHLQDVYQKASEVVALLEKQIC